MLGLDDIWMADWEAESEQRKQYCQQKYMHILLSNIPYFQKLKEHSGAKLLKLLAFNYTTLMAFNYTKLLAFNYTQKF